MELFEKRKTNYEFEPPFSNIEEFKAREQSLQASRLNYIKQYTTETFEDIVKDSDLLRPRLLDKKINYLEEKYIEILDNPDIPSEQKIVLLENSETVINFKLREHNEKFHSKKENKTIKSKNSLKEFKEKIRNARKAEILLSSGEEILNAIRAVNTNYPEIQKFIDFKLDTSCSRPHCLYKPINTIIRMPGENSSFYRKEVNGSLRKMMEEYLNIDKNEITESQIKTFIFLHEVGHAYDFIYNFISEYSSRKEAYEKLLERNKKSLQNLPIQKKGEDFRKISQNLKDGVLKLSEIEGLEEKYKNMDVNSFIKLQNKMIRELPEERIANEFAAEIMSNYWDIFHLK